MLAAHTEKSAPASIASSTASSVSANMSPSTTTTTTTFSKASEGLEGVPVWTFTTIKNMQEIVSSYEKKLEASEASPYLIFRVVTTDDLLKIERARENGKIDRGIRLTHYVGWDILILKVPTAKHEMAHRYFGQELTIGAAAMGLRREFRDLGATKFQVRRASKEGDTAFKPLSMRPREADWPTIVIEAGWSESLRKLRLDAGFWLEDSGGDVKIVLLISIGRRARTMIIEKWENRSVSPNRPFTRSNTTQIPTQIQAITIDSNSNTVNGAPLTLEFRKIFLRQAVPPLEHDFTFTAQDLSTFATIFWGSVQWGIGRIRLRRRTVQERVAVRERMAEVVRYCTSKLPCKMECGGKRAENSSQGRHFLPPFPQVRALRTCRVCVGTQAAAATGRGLCGRGAPVDELLQSRRLGLAPGPVAFGHVSMVAVRRPAWPSRGPSAWNGSGSRRPSTQSATYSASAGPCLKP